MTNTNFQNLFPAYANNAAYNTALDAELKVDENLPLIPGNINNNPSVNPGAWQYSPTPGATTAYTIGYGYDFSTKPGSQIESDFSTSGITLPQPVISALNSYTISLAQAQYDYTQNPTQANQQQLTNTQNELNAVSTAMANVVLTDAQATALMQPAIAVASATVQSTASGGVGNSTDLAFATGNNGLHALLVNEDYNGNQLFGANQLSDVETDNVDAFFANVLFFNNKAGGVYNQGVENRRIKDVAAYLGLPVPTETNSPDIVTGMNFSTSTSVAAAYIFSALVSQNAAITSQINGLGSTAQANLPSFLSQTTGNAETALQAASLYGVQQTDINAAANAGEDIWQYLAQKFGFVSTAALQAINGKFLSNVGNVVTFSSGQPDTGVGAGSVIHIVSSEVTGFPAINTIQTLDQQHTMLYDLNTGRTNMTGADVDGSDSGTFEIVDENGDTLASVQANTLTSAPTIVPIVAGAFIGAVQYTTSTNGTQTTAAPNYYDVQPGDGSLTSIAGELGLDPSLFAGVNPGLDPNATLATGTDLSLYTITNGPNGSQVHGTNNGITNNYNGQNGTGGLTGSQVTTPDGNGNSVTENYAGVGGTGVAGPITITLADTTGDYVTVSLTGTTFDLGATRVGNFPPDAVATLSYISGNIYSATIANFNNNGTFELLGGGVEAWPENRIDINMEERNSTAGHFSASIPTTASTEVYDPSINQDVTLSENLTFNTTGDVYAPAVAQVSENGTVLNGSPLYFYGHVGDHITQQFSVANIATVALTAANNNIYLRLQKAA